MIKNWKKATILGILLWILIFVLFTIIMFIPVVGNYTSYLAIIIGPLIVLLCGYYYFTAVPGGAVDGLVIGIYWLILGSILDAVITIPLFVKISYAAYFLSWTMLLGYALSLVAAIMSPLIFKKKI